MTQLRTLERVDTVGLFLPLHRELTEMLRSLDAGDWRRPTRAGAWRVFDVAAHLLDVDLRRLSVQRDGHALPPDRPVDDYPDLIAWLNALNAGWVAAMQRLSPAVLIELIELAGPAVARLFAALDPDAPALYPVAWAGEKTSVNWMDVARDYTERWHHQQQIRDAVGAPPLTAREWLHPLLDTAVRALPHAYRVLREPRDVSVVLEVHGDAADTWTMLSDGAQWTLLHGPHPQPAAHVTIRDDAAWRLLFNQLDTTAARAAMTVVGDERLVAPLIGARAVMV